MNFELINKIVIEEARKCFIKKLLPKDKEKLCFKVFKNSYSKDIAVNSCKRIRLETLKDVRGKFITDYSEMLRELDKKIEELKEKKK